MYKDYLYFVQTSDFEFHNLFELFDFPRASKGSSNIPESSWSLDPIRALDHSWHGVSVAVEPRG